MNEIFAQVVMILRFVWRNRWPALAATWFVCIAGWVYIATLRDVYMSQARVYVNTANILRPLLRGLAVESDTRAQVALMQRTLAGRPNLARVLDMTGKLTPDTGELEKAILIEQLERETSVRPVGDNLYLIVYRDRDPQQAYDVVQALLTIFIESNLGASRSEMDAARRFIEQQINDYEEQLERAELRLARFRQVNMDHLSGQAGYRGRVEGARSYLAEVKAQLRDAKVRRAALQKELVLEPPFFQQESTQIAGATPASVLRIRQLEVGLEDLLSRYTEEHPDVLIARRNLASARQQLDRDGGPTISRGNSTVIRSANPVYEQIKVRVVNQEAEIATLVGRIKGAEVRVDELLANAAQVPVVEAELTKLDRDYNVLKSKYESLLGRREAERISRAQQIGEEENQYRVVEPPEVSVRPVGPNRLAFFTLALLMGLGAGGSLALLFGFASDTISGIPQLREAIALPVLGGVSYVKSQAQRVGQLFEPMAFGAVVLGLFACYGGFIFFELNVGFGSLTLADASNLLQSALQLFV